MQCHAGNVTTALVAALVAAVLAGSSAASVIAAKHIKDDRTKYVTRGLDYLHAKKIVHFDLKSAVRRWGWI